MLFYYLYVQCQRGKPCGRFNKRRGVMKTALILALGFSIAVSSAALAQGKDPPGVNPTHFQCYRVSQQKPLQAEAKVTDQFGGPSYKLGAAMFLCAPASKNGEPVKDKETHLPATRSRPKTPARKWS